MADVIKDAFADASADIKPESIAVTASGKGNKSSNATSSATLNIKDNVTPDGVHLDPDIETDFEGKAAADSQQALVNQDADPVEPEVPVDLVDPGEPVRLTLARRLAQDNKPVNRVYSTDCINAIIYAIRRELLQNR